jgi:phosphotransferase system enzyme I (PtsI)
MAADPVLAVLLIGLGVNKLSMEPASLPLVRRVIREISYYEAERLADLALNAEDSAQAQKPIVDLLQKRLPEMFVNN